jgi:hypothetical protein
MRLTSIPALVVNDLVRVWRRRLIAGVVVLIFGFAALSEGVSALRLALHNLVGPVGARLILAGIFLLVVVLALVILGWRERRDAAIKAQRASQPFGGDERVSAIAEAINLGYSLAQDFRRGRGADAAQETAAQEKAGASNGQKPADTSSVRSEP